MGTVTNRERITQNNELLQQNNNKLDIAIQKSNDLPSSGGDVPIKLFETVELMQADTTKKEGDLAIVYHTGTRRPMPQEELTNATLKTTVTLAEKLAKSYTVSCEPNWELGFSR